jgi:hypothetical protein
MFPISGSPVIFAQNTFPLKNSAMSTEVEMAVNR